MIKKILNFSFNCTKGLYSFSDKISVAVLPDKIERTKFRHILSAPIFAGISYFLVMSFIPNCYTFAYDAVAMNFLVKEKTMTFGKQSTVTDHRVDKFSVFSCKEFPCNQSNSVEFRIRDSLYKDIVSVATSGAPYNPDSVAGVFISDKNECTIEYYGRRFKYLGFYPHIINASCTPI